MADKITMVRTYQGEFIIGYRDDSCVVLEDGSMPETDDLNLKDARIFQLQMTSRGAAIGLVPVFPFSNINKCDKITLKRSQIMVEVDESQIDGEICNAYKSEISGIDLSASAANNIITPH